MVKVKGILVFIAIVAIVIATTLSFVNVQSILHQNDVKFIGSINSHVYHDPSCPYAKDIKPRNLIRFNSKSDALIHGFRPCKICLKDGD